MLDIERDLQKNGMKPATNTAKRRVMAQNGNIYNKPKQKKKKTEISKRTKLTNAHLPELFRNLNGQLDLLMCTGGRVYVWINENTKMDDGL